MDKLIKTLDAMLQSNDPEQKAAAERCRKEITAAVQTGNQKKIRCAWTYAAEIVAVWGP